MQTTDLNIFITKSSNFWLRYTEKGNVSVQFSSFEQRALIMEGLKEQRLLNTVTIDEKNAVKSVLRGLPEFLIKNIAADFKSDVKWTTMKTKTKILGGSRLYLVQFYS